MKLALLTQHFAPHFEGGTEAVVRAQARELVALGFDVRVISGTDLPHEGVDQVRSEVDGFEVIHLPRLEAEFYDLLLKRPRLRQAVDELTRDRDVVHLHHWSTLDRELVRTLARRSPVFVSLHDLFVTCPRFFRIPENGVQRCPERARRDPELERCVACVAPDVPTIPEPSIEEGFRQRAAHFQSELDAAARLIVPSAAHARRLRRHVDVPEERTSVVPHGLCERITAAAGAAAWRGEGTLDVLFLGHRSALKGVGDLVSALAGLPLDLRRRVRLVAMGDEVQAGFDRELAEAAGDVELVFLGPYDLASLPARLAEAGGAHLAALPSRAFESYGLVVDEAQALGLPVWVSDRGAPPERVGGGGRVLPAEDPAAWTRAFAALFARPEELERERAALPRDVRTAGDAARELAGMYGRVAA